MVKISSFLSEDNYKTLCDVSSEETVNKTFQAVAKIINKKSTLETMLLTSFLLMAIDHHIHSEPDLTPESDFEQTSDSINNTIDKLLNLFAEGNMYLKYIENSKVAFN